MSEREIAVSENGKHPLDFKAEGTRTSKKPYIFDFHKARVCTHPCIREVVTGSHKYRCEECNYDFWLPTATMWPAHWGPIMGAFEILKFAKDFGLKALQQVYRTPIGQYDGTDHKPVLPDGKSFMDMLKEMDDHDILKAGEELIPALDSGRESEDDRGDDSPVSTVSED